MGLCMGVQPLMAYYYGAGDMETYQRGRDEVIYSYIRDWRCFRSGGNAWKQSSGWSVYPGFGSC